MESNTHGFVSSHTTSQESVIHASLMQSTLRMRQVSRNHFSLSFSSSLSLFSRAMTGTAEPVAWIMQGKSHLVKCMNLVIIALHNVKRVTRFTHASIDGITYIALHHLTTWAVTHYINHTLYTREKTKGE